MVGGTEVQRCPSGQVQRCRVRCRDAEGQRGRVAVVQMRCRVAVVQMRCRGAEVQKAEVQSRCR